MSKTSSKGRANTFFYKFIIGLIVVTVIYILTYAPYFYNVLSAYGIRGINAPACSIEALCIYINICFFDNYIESNLYIW